MDLNTLPSINNFKLILIELGLNLPLQHSASTSLLLSSIFFSFLCPVVIACLLQVAWSSEMRATQTTHRYGTIYVKLKISFISVLFTFHYILYVSRCWEHYSVTWDPRITCKLHSRLWRYPQQCRSTQSSLVRPQIQSAGISTEQIVNVLQPKRAKFI